LAKKRTKKAPRKRKAKEAPTELIVLPVRNMILFPGVALPLMVGRQRTIAAIQAAVQTSKPVGLLLQRDPDQEVPEPGDLYEVGTVAEILRYWPISDERHNAICQAHERFRIVDYVQTEPYLVARVERIPDAPEPTKGLTALFRALKARAGEVIDLAPGAPEDLGPAVAAMDSPTQLADLVCTFMDAPLADKQRLLETVDLRERLEGLMHVLGDLQEVLALSAKIRQDTKGSLDDAQREYFLREQLRAIRRELGDEEDADEELEDLRIRLKELQLPDDVDRQARKELKRLARLPEQSPEHPTLRTWFEVVTELPWNVLTKENLDLDRAARILDEDHYGLEKVKKRILETLAVRKLNPRGQGTILCLVGPPGVGKTSLGRSVARALGLEFSRLSLGGVHDEAEIRGHRRTYIGAMPGSVITSLRKAGASNPVFMLDELDKLGSGVHGDPSAALLEVLDPAQNNTFTDNYLGVPFDLSRVFFIGTANVLHAIPGPLRDRLEVIEIPGYTEQEKLEIAKRYLVPKQLEAAGLTTAQFGRMASGGAPCKIQAGALRELIRNHTREAGVRGLERAVGALCRHAATHFARGRRRKPLVIRAEDVETILGPAPFDHDVRRRVSTPGVATGLAWTAVGGEILFVEATAIPGKGQLILTGQLGGVMRESAQAALTLVRGRGLDLGVAPEFFRENDIHIHLPAGAVPKDGPSAGVPLVLALASLLTGRRVRDTVAATGEVSLQGLVLPVGGIKEKVLAAQAAGIKTVLLPGRNRADLEDIPAAVRERLEFRFLDRVEEALDLALLGRKS
tara:strand:+ start:10927 stop:13323 length:2397 start_codon:yes stop_codon:yes gene_type:complete